MTTADRPSTGLQTIFALFLGLMAFAFIGVGVNTFYPSPAERYTREDREISRQEQALNREAAPGHFTPAQQAALDSLNVARDQLNDRRQALTREWARVTSIVVVVAATLVLVVSLLLSERIQVLANGLLLGGLFSMVYGVAWVLFSGSSMARFWVIFFALVVAVALGYVKFVRRRRRPGPAAPAQPVPDRSLAELESRVAALEARSAAAAAALGGGGAGKA